MSINKYKLALGEREPMVLARPFGLVFTRTTQTTRLRRPFID